MLKKLLQDGFAQLNIQADEAAVERFCRYYERLTQANRVMNLTAISGEEDTARLHFLDCAALLNLTDFAGRRVIDVGSGAGFPGLVLKILRPEMDLTLLDSLDKRVRFLDELCRELGFSDVRCVHARAEEAPPDFREAYDLAVSRAVARLNLLSELCLPFVRVGGQFLAMKGPEAASERGIALLGGRTERLAEISVPGTALRHQVVMICKEREAPKKYPRKWGQMKKQPL